jgi:ribosomal protein S18 acetylase RimI-like enzyme
MTRKKLRAQRALQTCQRYFSRLGGKRPSQKMVALAHRCGFSADREVPTIRRSHKKCTPAGKRFKARLDFYARWIKSKGSLDPHRLFIQKPYFDERVGRALGYTEYLTQDGEIFYVAIDRDARHRGYAPQSPVPRDFGSGVKVVFLDDRRKRQTESDRGKLAA